MLTAKLLYRSAAVLTGIVLLISGSPGRAGPTVTWAPGQASLWVDAQNGEDGNDGLTPATAFQTIQRAAGVAGPGTIVPILPGVYRQAGDHEPWDGSWPDLHLTPASVLAIDQGAAALPASLAALLAHFAITDPVWGSAYDIGRYEAGHALEAEPLCWAIDPGQRAQYVLSPYPSDLPYSLTLGVTSPAPSLSVGLDRTMLLPPEAATLTVTDTHPGPVLQPGLWYTIPVTAAGGGFTQTVAVRLLVGGWRAHMPLVLHAAP